jgi:ketosteroid isomerase-like protein
MKYLTAVFVIACIFFTQLTGQNASQKTAVELRQFETSWLTANLNSDRSWLARFAGGKLNVLPPGSSFIKGRADAVNATTDTPLRPNEMKVRISGTISLLTNDPAQNRSYYFLDTFNKIGGKWQVIASSISPTVTQQVGEREQTERELVMLENEWARADTANDSSLLNKMLSPEFVGTLGAGKVRSRREWIDDSQKESMKSAVKTEMQVRVITDSLAIVTGVKITAGSEKDGTEIGHVDRFTDTWSKNAEGRWQCVASHVTRLHAGEKQNVLRTSYAEHTVAADVVLACGVEYIRRKSTRDR